MMIGIFLKSLELSNHPTNSTPDSPCRFKSQNHRVRERMLYPISIHATTVQIRLGFTQISAHKSVTAFQRIKGQSNQRGVIRIVLNH